MKPGVWRRAVAAGVLSWLCSGVAMAEDSIGICIAEDMQQQLHEEMRQLLHAVHDVHTALAERDFETLAERATAVGSAMEGQVEHTEDHHHAGMPHEFVKLGRATHAAFDQLAAQAREGGRPRELLPALAKVSAQCVACHDRYRIANPADCSADEISTD